MRRFGRRYGGGFGGWYRGWHRGGWSYGVQNEVMGYTYVGPCRCGWGPHAYYRDEEGNIVHAWEILGRSPEADLRRELEALKREKELLEKRIEELSRQLKDKEA